MVGVVGVVVGVVGVVVGVVAVVRGVDQSLALLVESTVLHRSYHLLHCSTC